MAPEHEPSEREQRVARLVRQAGEGVRAPAGLRAEVQEMQSRAGGRRRRRAGGRPTARARLRFGALATVLVAALAVVAVLLTGAGSVGAPSVAEAAALAGRGPAGPAPGPDPSAAGRLLAASVGDLWFPDWQADGGWRSTGQRTDRLADRSITTVYYSRGGTRLAYSIVAAPALAWPGPHREGYAVIRSGPRTVVVWELRDHTCLLSGIGVSAAQLWSLAARTLS